MSEANTVRPIEPKGRSAVTTATSTRVWPTLFAVVLQLGLILAWTSPAVGSFPRFILMMAGPLLCGLVFTLLLVFASRLPWKVSIAALLASLSMCIVSAVVAAPRSAMGSWLYGVPASMVLMWLGLWISRSWPTHSKLRTLISFTAVGWILLALTRVDGTDGYFLPTFSWRWTPTAESRLLANITAIENPTSRDGSIPDPTANTWQVVTEEWPGFRGPTNDSHVSEDLPKLDWTEETPRELWRRQVGPAWSSMCIVSGRFFTQEQRGSSEVVTCYNATTGEPIWAYQEKSRFEELNSGAGPRATPSYADGRVFSYGAKGILVAIDALTGERLWRHDLMEEVDAQLPIWGFTNSPCVFDDLVVVYAGGEGENGLMAFDCENGEVRWAVSSSGMNFGSAQPASFGDKKMLMFSGPGEVRGIEPTDGTLLWRYETNAGSTPPIVQPQQFEEDSAIVPFGDDNGIARIKVTRDAEDSWSVDEQWRTRNLKPWYNDFLIHEGAIFGFDKQIFASLNLADGSRYWKRGRFGFGQAVMLEEHEQVIVTTEKGEVILLDVDIKTLHERGRFSAFTGKSWNHPAVANGRLYVRSDSELACYQL